METYIYIVTALLTIVWSVWIYTLWGVKVKLREDSGYRFLLMILPSSFFLVIVFAGFKPSLFIRLDLIGLVFYDLSTIVSGVLILFGVYLFRGNTRKWYVFGVVFQILFSLGVVIVLLALRFFPPLLIKFSQIASEVKSVNLFAMLWGFLNPERHERDLYDFINKILIALFSYIPISIARFFYNRRKLNQILNEFDRVKRELGRLSEIEKRLEQLEKTRLNR